MVYTFILQKMDVLKKDPVVNNHLTFVLTKMTSEGKYFVNCTGNICQSKRSPSQSE